MADVDVDPPPPVNNGPPKMVRPPLPSENKTRIHKPMVCKVLLLNGEEFTVEIDRRSIGQLLYERVCDHVDLLERDYFGLTYKNDLDPEGIKFWLDPNKKIMKQKKRGKMEFEFSLKFYPPDPTQLTESITRYLVVLQIRRDIISGRLPCSVATQATLGSYAVQADIGDYDPVDHGTGTFYIEDMPFAPDQTPDLLRRIGDMHKMLKGQTPEEAELHYLEYAKKIALYGIELHRAKDSDYVDIMIGVGSTGVSIYRDNLRINRFVWPKILKISYRRNKFLLRLRPAEYETYESWVSFRLPNNKMAKRLWKTAVEHHSFLRLRSADDAKRRTGFPRFGSKYRYSGRTLHQTRMNASMADRPNKQFERAHSSKSLNSVLNNNRTRSHDNLNHRENYREQRSLDIHDMSFERPREPPARLDQPRPQLAPLERVVEQDDRTPFQSPLPQTESPKFNNTRVILHSVKDERKDSEDERETEDDDIDKRLPPVPKDSPQETRAERVSNHHSPKGIPTPFALANRENGVNSESEEEDDRPRRRNSSRGSSRSPERIEKSEKTETKEEEKVKPPVAPKPKKEKPPVAKKPEKPPKPEKPAKPTKEKPQKPEKAPKPKKEEKKKKEDKKDKKEKKEKMMEVSL